ncbi:hypothetical protein V5F44_19410 [Xanthobacter sp. V2C-8]|uniref:hypothetical protein n=1 Tax=Xanthobacter albus TaxID=3119929 RepID=UPI0037282068
MTRKDGAGRLPQLEAHVVGTVHHQARVMATSAPLTKHDGRVANDQDFAEMEADALHGRSVRNYKNIFNIK